MEQLPAIDGTELAAFDRLAGDHLRLHTAAHSDLQIDLFMLGMGGEGHSWGMYRQSLREIDSRRGRLIGSLNSLASLRLDVREKTIDAAENSSSTDARKQIAAERAVLELELICSKIDAEEGRIAVILRESEKLFARAAELLGSIRSASGLGPDDAIDDVMVAELDRDFWIHSMRQRIAYSSVAGSGIPQDILRILPLMPRAMASAIREAIRDPRSVLPAITANSVPAPAVRGLTGT